MTRPFINVTIPVYNEERTVLENVEKVAEFLRLNCRYSHEIVIVNNASTDRTLEVARGLEAGVRNVRVLHLAAQGRGGAIKAAWKESSADILSYMDVDLSTELEAFPALIEALVSGGCDLATGSRLLRGSLTKRGFKREFISRSYNLLVRALFRTRFSDAQCGFKAITKRAANALLPLVDDNGWFMDTELLVIAEKLGYRIFDLPVRWVDDPDTRVRFWRTAIEDIKGLIRVRRNLRKVARESRQ
jgi:glycosyltransferase involved in cell wall biosynthesis